MSDDELEDSREIIKIRRVKPKKKPDEKSSEEELKAKAATLKKRFRRAQFILALGLIFFIFLSFRSLSCLTIEKHNPPRRVSDDVVRTTQPSETAISTNARFSSQENGAKARVTACPPQPVPSFRYLFPVDPKKTALETAKCSPNAEQNGEVSDASPENLRVLRIASWNLESFDFSKLSDFQISSKTAKTIQEFDVVAIQGIRSKNNAVLEGIDYLIAQQGGNYSRVATTPGFGDEILAIFFDQNTVEVDRSTVSDAYDSQGRLSSPALIASFRPTFVDPKKCFTFQIVAVNLKNNPETNGPALVDLYRTLKNRAGALGVAEDDLLLVGKFGSPIQKIKELAKTPNLVAIRIPSSTDSDDDSTVNILFDGIATTEYVERFGIVDLAKYFKISSEEAEKISRSRPIWADFSVYEGGDPQFSASDTSKISPL